MRTVSDLVAPAGAQPSSQALPEKHPANINKATFADVGARMGEDNVVLRNLLIDTSHQLGAIDELKETFIKLVQPLYNVLTTLENEKAANASSQGALAAIRSSQDALRAEFQALEKESSELKCDNERRGRDLEAALQNARALDDDKAKLSGEVAAVRAAMAMLVKQLGDESGSVRVLSEEKQLLLDRADNSDKRVIGLEAEVADARERISLLENDKSTLQAALDRTSAEFSRVARRLATNESALTDSRSNIRAAEAKFLEETTARIEAENKLAHLAVVSEGLEQRTKKLEQDAVTLTARVEQDFVQLNATIEHERRERALAEGALETARSDYVRLQRQMAQERSTRRVDHQRRIVRNKLATPS